MMAHRVEFESRVQQIERTEDAVALGTEDQQKDWRKLTHMEAVLAQLPNDAESDELREKQHFLKGVLEWDLQRDYKARLWARRRASAISTGSSVRRSAVITKCKARATIGPRSSRL